MADFATMRELDVWYARVDLITVQQILTKPLSKAAEKQTRKRLAKARTRDSMQAYPKLVRVVDGQPRIIGAPPLIVPMADLLPDADRTALERAIGDLLNRYRRTLPSDRRALLDWFGFIDVAHKVVGVGSVGTRCWIVLLRGRDDDDPLFLQVKEAQQSVLADHVQATALPTYRNEGERVVAGQRLMQAASDVRRDLRLDSRACPCSLRGPNRAGM